MIRGGSGGSSGAAVDLPVADELAPLCAGAARAAAAARQGAAPPPAPVTAVAGPPAAVPPEAPVDGRRVPADYAELAERIDRGRALLGATRLVAVDGRAGSGKSTFARLLAAAVGARGGRATVFNTDEILQGWLDTVTFWPRLEEWILAPLRRGDPARYRRFDWTAGRFRAGWRTLGRPDVLILEGVSVARAIIRPELTASVFVHADRAERYRRAMRRDGPDAAGVWARWMLDEDAHFAADHTSGSVDVVVDTQATIPHQREAQFIRITADPSGDREVP